MCRIACTPCVFVNRIWGQWRYTVFAHKNVTSKCAKYTGNEHTVLLCRTGEVYTAGYNDNGQCGQGTTQRVGMLTRVPIAAGRKAVQVIPLCKPHLPTSVWTTTVSSRDVAVKNNFHRFLSLVGCSPFHAPNIVAHTVERVRHPFTYVLHSNAPALWLSIQ